MYLLDSYAACAHRLQEQLQLMDHVYAVLPGLDEVGMRQALTKNMEEKKAMSKMLTDLRATRAEAGQQADD